MISPKTVPEEFIHFIWENRLFHNKSLKTQSGEKVEIIQTGRRNTNAGPDFFNAQVKIDDTLWAGNIEIHKKASDWEKHNHSSNKAYENVILHVVEEADKSTFRMNGTQIPTLVITWPEQFTRNYRKLLDSKSWIACQEQFHQVDPVLLRLGFNRLMIERLENKTGEIEKRLIENKNNWNETFYQMLARMFGFKVNAVPFELLAKAVPMQILAKHKSNLFQLEALLFGTSGLLHEELIGDEYFIKLRDEYSFLYKKYNLKTVEPHLWKFMRLRPVNFPTIRIAQLAHLIQKSQGLFSKIIETDNLPGLKNLFEVKASDYWDSHYRFNKNTTRSQPKELGETSINTLIINVVAPFLFVYGEKQNQEHLKNRALDFLEQLPAEKNSIVKNWEVLGIQPRSAFETQALIELKTHYCEPKKCLNCQIGNKLVKTTP
ncbi:Protein of unknown function [Tangfeifania diversioriginum]|uniref:DUF2851 domain-containing protein n=1 Tax=Tangfeifania diversioriginum TaxID=1168035 RepID=A0A1M6MEI9_9BACT|nr:DUF2851 family protein [Tangfeifania diversioriginum]SHJ81932.1 Protein of unknown function [Tangfeifania diversioriginum]